MSGLSLAHFVVLAAILFSLDNERVRGPVNLTAPAPVTNAEFAKTLARVLHRPLLWLHPPHLE